MKPVRLAGQALAVVLVVGLLGLLVWKVAHQLGHATVASEVRKGKKPAVPAFSLPTLGNSGALASASLGGKVGVINFWASWCIPCRDEAPLLEDASRRLASRGVTVVGIDHQDFAGDARGFVRKYRMTYPTVVDKGDKLYTSFGLTGVPETFCTNRAGRVVAHVPGAVTRETLHQCIQDALSS
jgi:cytochrome c biogenesis protein CcmG/thiol:disulfide interchange protein DsbE